MRNNCRVKIIIGCFILAILGISLSYFFYHSIKTSRNNCRTIKSKITKQSSRITGSNKQIIEDIPSYLDAEDVPADMAFAGKESIKLLREIYREIEFIGTYKYGNTRLSKEFRSALTPFLQGENLSELNDEAYRMGILYSTDAYKNNIGCNLYFFDMDNDKLPELCVEGEKGTFVCKYDVAEKEPYIWWGCEHEGYTILGTQKIAWGIDENKECFLQLDGDGNTEFSVVFEISYYPEKKYFVSVPDFKSRLK